MRALLVPCLYLAMVTAQAQCGREYPSGFWHNTDVVLASGDTINRLDSTGLYHGWHVYSMDRDDRMHDTLSYLFGRFEHGRPVGTWADHCADGSWSEGSFSMGSGEVHVSPTGEKVHKDQGLYNKIGIWRYYDRDNALLRTVRYVHSTPTHDGTKWTHRIDVLDPKGHWHTTELIRNGPGPYAAPSHKRLERTWTEEGLPIAHDRKRPHGSLRKQYHSDGRLKRSTRCGWSIWHLHFRCVTRTYDGQGKLKEKHVTLRVEHPPKRSGKADDRDVF